MNELKVTVADITENRKEQIKKGFQTFKSRKDHVFTDPDIKAGRLVKLTIGEEIVKQEKIIEK